jgi:serine/threonine-protein kinase
VKILDFGVAKVMGSPTALTVAGTILGTPVYMSPEHCVGDLGPWSDLYSLGAIAYHALAGRPVFTGDTLSLVRQHVNDAPRPLGELVPGLDPRIEALVMGLLAKRPEHRVGSAAALATKIDDLEKQAVPLPRKRRFLPRFLHARSA